MKKQIKVALVAILAVGLLGSSIVFSQNAIGQEPKGETIILEDFRNYSEDPTIKKVTEIMEKLNNDELSSSTQTTLLNELSDIRSQYESQDSSEKTKELLSNVISNSATLSSSDPNYLPIIGMYADHKGKLVVQVDAMVYDKQAKKVAEKVRQIIGDETDLIIEPMKPIVPHCSQTGNCEPAQAGVKIETGYFQPCTLGFKASYNGMDGFVTAGHCNGGSQSGTVAQPTWWYSNHIGDVKKNTFSNGTDFDGMFVEADETISDKIYNNNDVNSLGYSSYLDGVTMEGHVTKGEFGVVIDPSWDGCTYPSGSCVWLIDMAYTTYDGSGGDSGAPVWGAIPTKNFHGIHHGGNGNESIFSKQYNAFSGLSWDFS